MTAQVAVLNTHGIALASDSAVTVSDGEHSRSYQSADKIFPIHGVPLAVLRSGNAAIWGVPWQLLVEMWAQSRDGQQNDSVEAYAAEFRTWLASQHALATEAAQDDFLRWTVRDCLLTLRARIRGELAADDVEIEAGHVDGPAGAQIDAIVDEFMEMVEGREDYRGMADVDAVAICKRLTSQLEADYAWVFDDTPSTPKLDRQAKKLAEMLVHKAEPFSTDAVLAFAGYGKDDYFPSLYQMTVSGVVGGVVRFYDDSRATVTADSRVSITPLGLTEAIQAFLRGTSPSTGSPRTRFWTPTLRTTTARRRERRAIALTSGSTPSSTSWSGSSFCPRCWTSSRHCRWWKRSVSRTRSSASPRCVS